MPLIKIKSFFKIFQKNGRTIAIYMLILLLIKQFIIYKIYYQEFTGVDFGKAFYSYMWFLASDFMIFSIVLILVIINFSIKIKFLKTFFNVLNIWIITLFFADILINYYFQSRLSLMDIYSFMSYSDSNSFNNYLIPIIWIFLSVFFIIYFIVQNYIKYLDKLKIFVYFFIFSITLWLLSFLNYYFFNNTMDDNIFTINTNTILKKDSESTFSNDTVGKKYEDYFGYITGLNQRPNVILIFAESFSTIDSKRVWWIHDNFPNFDKIQSEGMTFTNFLSNWYTSDTAHIALLKWVEPRNTPNQQSNKFYEIYKSYTDSLPEFFNRYWYHSTFLSAVTLDFFDQKKFLSWTQFQEIIWEEAFKDEKKYVFDAAPDHVLYKKAISLTQKFESENKPYFLVLQTISSHKPYNTPYWNTFEKAIEYTDDSLYWFYQNLKSSHFFESWILLIAADHRKMEPMGNTEIQKYWLSANGRWLVTIVWKWIESNSFNTKITQHTDLFYSLKYLIWWENILVSSLFNNIFSTDENRDRWMTYCHFCPYKKYIVLDNSWRSYQFKNIEGLSSWNKNISDYMKAYYLFQSQTWVSY